MQNIELKYGKSSISFDYDENRFDILFFDIEIPEINGLELCLKLRELPLHAETPVVFMTTVSQFEPYLRLALNGGNDIIAKPFHYSEVIVKALTMLLKSRVKNPALFRSTKA